MWVLLIFQSMLVFDPDTKTFQGSTMSVSQINQEGFNARVFASERECEDVLQLFAKDHPQLDFVSHWSVDTAKVFPEPDGP